MDEEEHEEIKKEVDEVIMMNAEFKTRFSNTSRDKDFVKIPSGMAQEGVYFGTEEIDDTGHVKIIHKKCDFCNKLAERYCEFCRKLMCLDCYQIIAPSRDSQKYYVVCINCKKKSKGY